MARPTLKSLVQEIHDIAEEASGAVTVKLGNTVYTLKGAYIGAVVGERFGALIIGDKTWFLELDRKGSPRSAKVVQSPDPSVLSRELLPEPPLPPEVVAAQEMLDRLKLPKGFHLSIDARGNPTIKRVDGGSGGESTGEPQLASKKQASSSEEKPPVAKGTILTRSKDGHKYKVVGVDANLKKIFLEPVAGEGEKNLAAAYPTASFWKNWKEAGG